MAARKPQRSPRRRGAVLLLLTPEEREEMRTRAAAVGLALAPWMRTTLLREARRPE